MLNKIARPDLSGKSRLSIEKAIFAGKKLFLFLVFSLFAVIQTAVAQQEPQDPIRQAEGILLSAPLHYDWVKPISGSPGNPGAVDSMRNHAGIDIVHLNIDREGQVDTLATNREYPYNYGFYVMPHRMLGLDLNYVQHYTHAKYSVWEAEGNANYIVNLARDPVKTEIDTYGDTTFVRRRGNIQNSVDSMIFGPEPWYTQDVKYHGSNDGTCDTVRYTASFRLMLEENNQGYPPIEGNPDDTICVIQVTQSDTLCTFVIQERIITRGEFDELNRFYEFRLDTVNNYDYRLTSDSCQARKGPIPTDCGTIRLRSNVEFKVIWMGKSNAQGYPAYLLSVDKVTLSEERGQLMFGESSGDVKTLIESQADALSQYHNNMVGYIGPDEPRSIDLHAPMKRVTEILDDRTQWKRPLWLFYAGGELYNKIIKNRVVRTNIALATFMFDLPCKPDTSCYDDCPPGTDVYDHNIRWHSNNFKYAYELDPYYGINLQTGASKPPYGKCSHQRNIARHELLYSANLALMHGAKFLSFSVQGYFAQRAISDSLNPEGWSYHAIVDFTGTSLKNTIYTDKFSMVKDTLSPRLAGLFGKTIKKLIPGLDSLNINPSMGYDLNLSHLKQIELVRDGGEDLESYVDLRFFRHPQEYDDNYFMIINRWYSKSIYNRFRLKLKDLLGYNNWNLKNFMDSTNTTLLPDQNGNVTSPTDTILIGDAILYSIKPVVTDGGTLLVDEYAGEGMILQDDMIITNGAKLSIVGNYYAKGDIIIENGSIDIYTDQYSGTPNIYFEDGKKLIVKGPAVISGDEENKLILDFISPDHSNGIVIKLGGTLTVSNSIVKNARTGILGELNVTYLNAEYVDFIDCESKSILMLGQSMEERGISSPPPSQIKNCTITNSIHGIWASNLPQLIIQQNEITDTDLGIILSNISSPLIIGNAITSTKNEQPGIYLESCNGSIRSNTITGHTDGIHLGNSSPGIGGNNIHNNYLHGIYIGTGSLPDMMARLGGSPPQWYAIAGYNNIYENGGYSEPSSEDNDGSEIYLNYSNVYLTEGCNRITDNRLPDNKLQPPLVNTQLLMNGEGSDPFEVFAEGNFWDEHQLYSLEERFGNITVYYEPELSEPCPEPQGGSEEMILFSYSGEPVDTAYSIQREVESLSSTELLYSEAEEKFASADYSGSETIYNQIISGNDPVKIKQKAYRRLYEIGHLSFKPEEYFNDLNSLYTAVSQAENDSLMKKLFKQLASLSLIGEVEYVSAITEFDNIINQNPNSEEAVYAEIDALTKALLVEDGDTTLQKSAIGKYLVKSSGDSFSRIDGLLRKNFGVKSGQSKEVEVPKQYSLYQNYPNPFNPMTTIKYDLPKDGSVTLEIFDILGRKVVTLVNEYKSAGSYSHLFNASLYASGVYIYKLQAGDYVSSKKMILVK